MSHSIDWQVYVNNTAARFVTRFLDHARSHDQATTRDFDALAQEHHALLEAMDRAYHAASWDDVRAFTRAVALPANGYLGVRGYWEEVELRLRQALFASRVTQHIGDLMAFGGELGYLWYLQGNWTQAAQCFDQAQQILDTFEASALIRDMRGTLYQRQGLLAQAQGRLDEAETLYRKSLRLKEAAGNVKGVAAAIHQLGLVAQARGHDLKAASDFDRSQAIQESTPTQDDRGQAITRHQQGILATRAGRYEEARSLLLESLALKAKLGDKAGEARTRHQLGIVAYFQERWGEARQQYEKSMALKEELGDQPGMVTTLFHLGQLEMRLDKPADARVWLERCLLLQEKLSMGVDQVATLAALGMLAQQTADLPLARTYYERGLVLAQAAGDVTLIASLSERLAQLAQQGGEHA